jgi:2,3-bisphosphoglycerate-dependent phosphoglycerate mutase
MKRQGQKRMKRTAAIVILIIIHMGLTVPESSFAEEKNQITTLILVRHAEKAAGVWEDPGLTPSGAARADELAYILKYVELDAIYSTSFERTKQTVFPTAKQKGLEVKLYKPNDKGFLKKILEAFPGGTVLIVGHSNTIPKLANELAGQAMFSDLDDAIYDNLFVACVPSGGNATVIRMRFGVHTPEKE